MPWIWKAESIYGSALDTDSSSCPRRFSSRNQPPVLIVQDAGWSPEPVWALWRREKYLIPVGYRTPSSQVIQPVALPGIICFSRYKGDDIDILFLNNTEILSTHNCSHALLFYTQPVRDRNCHMTSQNISIKSVTEKSLSFPILFH
jgi:hypothetical protein